MEQPDNVLIAASWVIGGLGLFLYGVHMLSEGLREAAGERLRRLIAKGTRFPVVGLLIGATVTAFLQSSSATTVMVVSFVDAGLMTLANSVGIILGSGIGSTVTAQIISFPWIDIVALPAIGIGLLLHLFAPRKSVRLVGQAILGFGMIFFGFILMKSAVAHWQDTTIREWFSYLGRGSLLSMAIAVTVAALATAVVQSSGATIGIVMALAGEGVVTDLHVAIPLVIGCNIGTTVTALLAAVGSTVTARRAAWLHVTFRILGGGLTLLLISYYEKLVPLTASDIAHQIANFHTLHNVVNAILFLPFAGLLAKALTRLVPGKEELTPAPLFIDFSKEHPADEVVEQSRREVLRLLVTSREMTADAIRGMIDNDDALLESVLKRERIVDTLHGTITEFLISRNHRQSLDTGTLDFVVLLQVVHHVERIGDHAENLVELARVHRSRAFQLEESMLTMIRDAGRAVDAMAETAISALDGGDRTEADAISTMRKELQNVVRQQLKDCYQRVGAGTCPAIAAVLFDGILANLTSTATHLRKAVRTYFGYPLMPETGELDDSGGEA